VTPAALLAGVAAAALAVSLCELAATRPASGRPRRGRAALALLAGLGRLVGREPPAALRVRLEAAGIAVPVGDVMAIKAGAAILALGLALPLAALVPGRLGPLLAVGGPGVAFIAPDLWLRRRARARAAAMQDELADVLDLLRVAVAAGLAPARALAEVGRRHPGLLARELRRAAAAIALGEPHLAALDTLERRCPLPGVRPLAAALRQAVRHGAPLGPALASQALEARAHGARLAGEAAARAAPKIQLVVALLLVPAVLLLVAAALLPALLGL